LIQSFLTFHDSNHLIHISRSLSWLEEGKDLASQLSTQSDHRKKGDDIIRQALELLKSLEQFEQLLVNSKSAEKISLDMFFAHCFCLKIGTIRSFAYSPWQIGYPSRAGIEQSRVQNYAVSTLRCIENRMKHAGLEAVIYLSHHVAIAVEIRDLNGRRRVLSLLRTVRGRGFTVADACISDVELAWKAVGPMPESEL
jgi:hypothetical protein